MKTLMTLAAAAALSCSAAAAEAKADAAKQTRLKELAKIVEENSMGHGPWNRCFLKYYCPTELGKDVKACTDAEWAEMKAKCLAALKESYELDPTPGRAVAYANGLHFLGRYAEAMPLYEGALEKLRAQKNPDAKTLGWGLLSLAECKLALGDRAATIEILKDLSARKLNFGRYGGSPSGEAAGALPFLEERVLDYCKLPRFTDAKAFPTAQKPEYRDTFAPLGKNLAVKASGIADDDPRFGFFETKLRRLGVEVGHRGVLGAVTGLFSGDYVLEIEVRDDVADFAALKPFQRREAYVLETAKGGAKLTAETKQGVLWGLVTFVQMTDPKQVRVREGRVVDWPATAERGFLSTSCWPGCFEYSLMCKFNNVNFQGNPVRSGGFTPLRWLVNEQMAKCYVSYGLTVYFGICDLTMAPNLPITQPRTLQIQADTCRRYAKVGAGVYYPYDDCRYPMNPQDKEATGNLARTIDADHIQKLYETVAKDYPDFKLIFCPPFYWGPDSNSDGYSEDREEYLKTLRKLDPKIDLYWTGPMVKSFDMTKRQVKWFTDLTGHKPSIFQNGMNVHRFLTNMLTDDFDFAGWHYPEFYEDISLFHANSHMNLDAARDTSVAEGLWNPAAYEPLAAAKNGTDMLLGEKVFDTLRPGRDALAYFDKYPRDNNLSVDILSEKPAELQAKIDLARDCWKRAKEMHPDIGGSHYVPLISWCERIVQAAKNPPDTLTRYKQDIEQVERQAKEEVGVDKQKGDLLYTPASVNGGQFFVYAAFDPGSARAGATKAFEHPIPKRLVRCLRGKGVTGRNATGFHFECDPFPPTGDYEMYVNGMDDETPRQNVLRVTVNDKVVYEQAPGFSDNTGYSVKKIVIPFTAMKRHNDVVIQNVTPGSNPNGTPWMMINYIVLKKAPAKAK